MSCRTAITVCATKSYTYAMWAQARRVQGMILQTPQVKDQPGVVILVGDDCGEMQSVENLYKNELLPPLWEVKRIQGDFRDGFRNYKNSAQLVIAHMRSLAFDEARRRDVDFCLSLDSDVLPQSNSLEVMIQMLAFDRGYYAISSCPYPSQGNGDFLFGRGIPTNPILPDVYPDERLLPEELMRRMKIHDDRLRELLGQPDEEWLKERDAISHGINECPPKGDVFFRNSTTGVVPFVEQLKQRMTQELARRIARGWEDGPMMERMGHVFRAIDEEAARWRPTSFRRRGWGSSAYPGIGRGAILPTDWCGFGCTTMSRTALALAQFDGYDGGGTEDLFIIYKRWVRAGLRINAIPHSPVDHVIRDPKKTGKYILLQAHHESHHPECEGHLRLETRPWFQQKDGEIDPAWESAIIAEENPDNWSI